MLDKIKKYLKEKKVKEAEDSLITLLGTNSIKWQLDRNIKHVLKIFLYIRKITFSADFPTAFVDLSKGHVLFGIDFFIEWVRTFEDLLFVILHERNHLILKSLYNSPVGFADPQERNLAEDAFINGPLTVFLEFKSTLIPRYYAKAPPSPILLLQPDPKPLRKWLRSLDIFHSHKKIIANVYQSYRSLYNPQGTSVNYSTWMLQVRNFLRYLPPLDSYESLGLLGHSETKNPLKDPCGSKGPKKDIKGYLGEAASSDKEAEEKPPGFGVSKEKGVTEVYVEPVDFNSLETELILETFDSSLEPFVTKEIFLDNKNNIEQLQVLIGAIFSSFEDHNVPYKLVYPNKIGRRETFLLSSGIIPHNWTTNMEYQGPEVFLYVDVSGSMEGYYIFIPYIVKKLSVFCNYVYHFSTKVIKRPKDTNTLVTTKGTHYDVVAEHIIENKAQKVIILTDNTDRLSPKYKKVLFERRVEIFLISTKKDFRELGFDGLAKKEIVLTGDYNE